MRKMGIGLGVGINRSNYAQGIFNAYSARVVADGGVVESGTCVDAVSSLLQSASLLLIPSGYKGGKLYSEIPTNGNGDLTWTRGSDAFRTNASGLIERVPWNLVQQSESFNNAIWTKFATTITADATLSPIGTLTADNAVPNTSNTDHSLTQYFVQAISGNTYTISVYAKPNGYNFIRLSFGNVAGGGYTFFDVSNGTIGGTSSMLSNSITPVGNGWYRCTVSRTATTSGTLAIDIYIVSANNQFSWAGNGTDGVFIWGAQVVEGTTAQTYLPTTDRLNFPRLSYMYGSCPSALLEPQRTNLLANQLSYNASTGVAYNTSVTDSPIIGINSARITKNEASGTVRYANQNCANSALTGSTTYTISAYFKYDGYDFQTSMEYNSSLQWGGVSWAQPINIASTGVTLGSSTSCTGSVQNVGNGWYRVSVTITTGAVIGGVTPVTYLMRLPSTLSTGQGFLQAVPQFEQGAYSTTVIPTSGATATRVADSFSRNNIYTNGLISASGGTWFAELRGNIVYTRDAGNTGIFIGDDTNATNSFRFRTFGGGARIAIVKSIATTESTLYITTTDTVKFAIKWNGSTADVFVNGTKQVSATTFTTTAMEFLMGNANDCPKFIQQMALFNTPLTDTQCQTLTT